MTNTATCRKRSLPSCQWRGQRWSGSRDVDLFITLPPDVAASRRMLNFNRVIKIWYIQGVYKRMVRFQKCIKRLHSATERCSPHSPPLTPIFTGMYENYSIVFSNSAGSDMLQMETTTYTYNMGRILSSCGCVSCDLGAHIEGLWLMYKNLDSCRCCRCTFCPCKVRNKFLVNFWNCTILLWIPCILFTLHVHFWWFKLIAKPVFANKIERVQACIDARGHHFQHLL
jgi:hypothetical protein